MIVIIDYGMGNLRSVLKAIERLKIKAMVTSNTDIISQATKLILPGVGHFKNGMDNLIKLGLVEILHKKVTKDAIPILGICLGMQLFTKHSQEGNVNGMAWIDACTLKFKFDETSRALKIPHMGWNNLNIIRESNLLKKISEKEPFYFVHSYYTKCNDINNVLCITHYGIDFVSAFQKSNIYGVQFHPEKSHLAGLNIIKNFIYHC